MSNYSSTANSDGISQDRHARKSLAVPSTGWVHSSVCTRAGVGTIKWVSRSSSVNSGSSAQQTCGEKYRVVKGWAENHCFNIVCSVTWRCKSQQEETWRGFQPVKKNAAKNPHRSFLGRRSDVIRPNLEWSPWKIGRLNRNWKYSCSLSLNDRLDLLTCNPIYRCDRRRACWFVYACDWWRDFKREWDFRVCEQAY